MYVCMYARSWNVYVCLCVCVCVCLSVCLSVCLYVCMYVHRCVWDSNEGTKKTTKILTQESRSPDQDFNPGHLEYEARVLDVRLCCNITKNMFVLYTDSKWFWRRCIKLRITAFLDLVRRLVFQNGREFECFGNWICFNPQIRGRYLLCWFP
jgi:hypothetical protein